METIERLETPETPAPAAIQTPGTVPGHPNLIPWQPGQSGNPGGRRKRIMSDRYAEQLEKKLPEHIRAVMNNNGEELAPGATWGDAIALQSARDALKPGGVLARKEMREAIEGKAPQRLEIINPQEKKMEIAVMFKRAEVGNAKAETIEVGINETKELENSVAVKQAMVAANEE